MGDMAVSNSIGSNVFDILVGLGLPWAIKTLAISYGTDVGTHVVVLALLAVVVNAALFNVAQQRLHHCAGPLHFTMKVMMKVDFCTPSSSPSSFFSFTVARAVCTVCAEKFPRGDQ